MTRLIIVTGFLGSGKTTLLTHVIRSAQHTEKIAVIVNEFAAIGIDGRIMNDGGMEIKELSNGCVCCTKSKDLEETINYLKGKGVDTIILETTGVAALMPLIDIAQRTNVELSTIVTVVDAYRAQASQDWGIISKQQILLSSAIVLNKIDLVTPASQKVIVASIRALNNHAALHTVHMGSLTFSQLRESPPLRLPRRARHGMAQGAIRLLFPKINQDPGSKHLSRSGLGSVSFVTQERICRKAFEQLIRQTGLFRAKGFVNFSDNPETQLFNYSSGLITIEPSKEQEASSKIVLIGKMSFIKKIALIRKLGSLSDGKGEIMTNLKNFIKTM